MKMKNYKIRCIKSSFFFIAILPILLVLVVSFILSREIFPAMDLSYLESEYNTEAKSSWKLEFDYFFIFSHCNCHYNQYQENESCGEDFE